MDALRIARREAFEEAARIADKVGDKIMKQAERMHDADEYDLYEEMECQAVVASEVAQAIRKAAKRRLKRTSGVN